MSVDQSDIEARSLEIRAWYQMHKFKCQALEAKAVQRIQGLLDAASLKGAAVEARTKSVDSYVAKATKVEATGEFKYADPRTEITDAVGLRIMVPLSTDVPPVSALIREHYQVDEEVDRGEEESQIEPGYRSLHLLLRLEDGDNAFQDFGDMVVELQVRTILQHAWASLQHDIVYKSERQPSASTKRRLTSLAGLLELADREFISVRQTHATGPEQNLDRAHQATGPVTGTALRNLAEQLFGEDDPASHEWFMELKTVVEQLGLDTIADVRLALGQVAERAPEVAMSVRLQRPWANSAYVLDLLLRLAFQEEYVDRRPPSTGASPAEIQAAKELLRADFTFLDLETVER